MLRYGLPDPHLSLTVKLLMPLNLLRAKNQFQIPMKLFVSEAEP